jgi:uncharacterized protein (DUF885 family)
MRYTAFSRRGVISVSVYSLIIVVLAAPMAQAAPIGADDLRQRVQVKVDELAKAIDQQVEVRRQVQRADSALAIYEEAAAGGNGVDAMDPNLKNNRYQVKSVQIERDIMLDNTGAENPRYKSLAKRTEEMEKALHRQIEAAKAEAAKGLLEARREAATAKARLEAANGRVEEIKRELVELAAGRR